MEPTTSRVEMEGFLSRRRSSHVISLFKWSSPNYINERTFLDTYRLCSIWFDDKCMLLSFCFFTQYTPPDYLPKVYEDLPMSPTHREAVINAFVYVHQTLHQANERLAKRGGRVMAITPRHYLDFINHYVSIIHVSEMAKTMGSKGGVGSESTCLPPVWTGFKSRRWRHSWVEFVVGSFLWPERFFSGFSGFALCLKKQQFQIPIRSGTFLNGFLRFFQSYLSEQITPLWKKKWCGTCFSVVIIRKQAKTIIFQSVIILFFCILGQTFQWEEIGPWRAAASLECWSTENPRDCGSGEE